MSHAEPPHGNQGAIASWAERPLDELLDYILARYHRPLRLAIRETKAQLEQMQERRAATPGSDWHRLDAIDGCFASFSEELLLDMTKEEGVLFPWIRAGHGATALAPITVMQQDHARIEALVVELCRLGCDLARSFPAESDVESLQRQLAEIQVAMREHLQLEELLFMRALMS